MMDFLEANVCITRAEYSRLVHVTARRASRDLQTFIDSGVIRKRGAGRSVVYVKGCTYYIPMRARIYIMCPLPSFLSFPLKNML